MCLFRLKAQLISDLHQAANTVFGALRSYFQTVFHPLGHLLASSAETRMIKKACIICIIIFYSLDLVLTSRLSCYGHDNPMLITAALVKSRALAL